MKIALCGSLSLGDEFLKIKEELETKGHEILIPESIRRFSLKTAEDVEEFKSEKNNYLKVKPIYMQEHFEKIKKSDAILVVNKAKRGIENYIGGNTFAEIMIAFFLNKKIFLLNPIPAYEKFDAFREEIESINPIVLNGDLNRLG